MPPTTPLPNAAVSYSKQYRRCGKPDCPACRPGLPGHGPYWYARWQEGGRTRSRYIGRQEPSETAALSTPVTPMVPALSVEEDDAERDESRMLTRSGAGAAAAHDRAADTGDAGVSPAFITPGVDEQRQRASALPDTVRILPSAGAGKRAAPSGATPTPTVATAPPALRVRTLGAFTVWRGDEPIEQGRWSRRTVAALFKCLLTAPGHRLSREQTVDTLWPDADGDRGDTNLRATIHRLRAVLDEPGATTSYLRSEGPILILDPHWVESSAGHQHRNPAHGAQHEVPGDWLDADAFARAARRALAGGDIAASGSPVMRGRGTSARRALAGGDIAAGRAALDLYDGDYLPDDLYEDWAAARREELRQQYHALLLHVAGLTADAGDTAEAARYLRLLLAADPCHEPATRLLMRLLAGNGERAEALRVYAVLARALRDDLDVVPTPETETVRALLLVDESPPAVPSRGPQPAPTNMPAALTSFVGRGRELAAVEYALAQGPGGCRLLTLTGAGGGGKTRLALEAAAAVLPRYPDGVWLVELAALADPALVPAAVAAVLDLRELPGASFTATLADTLQARRMLLVLDNCEHLVAACADLAARLLRTCPQLQILATSREALGMAGETVWRLPPLSLPPLTDDLREDHRADVPARGAPVGDVVAEAGELDRVQRFEAVQLFVERARASRPDFTLTRQNAAAVAHVCRRLDGLPLAIELAAARLGVLSVRDVAARLDDRFRLLTAGNRAALPRHQTLRGVLDWSYTLLSATEQALLRRLAVFVGGWTLRAAEAVCAGGPVRECDVLDLLAGLEAKSLVVLATDSAPVGGDGESRYGLLETVRQYAAGHLAASAELAALDAAHAADVLALAERAEPGLRGPEQRRWLDRLEAEHDNVRAALTWGTREGADAPDTGTALRLTGALGWFWLLHGHLSEGRRWAALALSRPCQSGDDTARLRAGALNVAGMLAERQHDYDPAEGALRESVTLYRALGDDHGTADALNNLGHVAWDRGDYAWAYTLFQESLSLRRGLGDDRGVASSLNNLARVHRYQGDVEAAMVLYEQSLTLWKRVGEPWGIANLLSNLGLEMGERGDYQQALALHQESLALRRELGDKLGISWSLTNVASVDTRLGNYDRAVILFEESLLLARQLGDKANVTDIVEGLAEVAQARGEMVRAARLFGGVDMLRAATGDPLSPSERARYDRNVAAVRAALGESGFAPLWREGQTMTAEETIAYAREQ